MKKCICFLTLILICSLLFATGGGGGDDHSCHSIHYDAGSDSRTFYRAYNTGSSTVSVTWSNFGSYVDKSSYIEASYTTYGLGHPDGYRLYQNVGYKGTNQGSGNLNSILNSTDSWALNYIIPYNCRFV